MLLLLMLCDWWRTWAPWEWMVPAWWRWPA